MLITPVDLRGYIGTNFRVEDVRAAIRDAGRFAALEFRIDSIGGSSSEAMYIADAIKAHAGPTTARVPGYVASAALLLIAACKFRSASPAARFAFHHPVATWANTSRRELQNFAARYVLSIAASSNGRASVMDIQRLMDIEAVIGASQALRLGIVDEVI